MYGQGREIHRFPMFRVLYNRDVDRNRRHMVYGCCNTVSHTVPPVTLMYTTVTYGRQLLIRVCLPVRYCRAVYGTVGSPTLRGPTFSLHADFH